MKKILTIFVLLLHSNLYATEKSVDELACAALKGLSIGVDTSIKLAPKNPVSTDEALIMSNTRNTHIRAILNNSYLVDIENYLQGRNSVVLFRNFTRLYEKAIDTRSCTSKNKGNCIDDLNRQSNDMRQALNILSDLVELTCF